MFNFFTPAQNYLEETGDIMAEKGFVIEIALRMQCMIFVTEFSSSLLLGITHITKHQEQINC